MEAEASFSLKQWKLSQDYSVDVVFSTIGLIACLVGAGVLFRYGMRTPQGPQVNRNDQRRHL